MEVGVGVAEVAAVVLALRAVVFVFASINAKMMTRSVPNPATARRRILLSILFRLTIIYSIRNVAMRNITKHRDTCASNRWSAILKPVFSHLLVKDYNEPIKTCQEHKKGLFTHSELKSLYETENLF